MDGGQADVPLSLIDVERIESDSDSRHIDVLLDLVDFCTKCLGVVVTSTGKLDMITSLENSRDETGLDRTRCPAYLISTELQKGAEMCIHSSDHERRLVEKAREGCINVYLAIGSAYETR